MTYLKHTMIGLTTVAVVMLVAANVSWSQTPVPTFGDPLPGLTAEELAAFEAGKAEFLEVETIEEGLGPVFNNTSCAGCHDNPAVGGDTNVRETRFGTTKQAARALKKSGRNVPSDREQHMDKNRKFNPMEDVGGSLIQRNGIGPFGECNFVGEVVPTPEAPIEGRVATILMRRKSTSTLGLGFVEALEGKTIKQITAHQHPSIRGKVHRVKNPITGKTQVGRLGHKCQIDDLDVFGAEAYLQELGITTPTFPAENCPQGDCTLIERCNPVADPEDDGSGAAVFADFMRLSAPPPRGEITAEVMAGEQVFAQIGCAGCHIPTLTTGPSSIAALHQVMFDPFSDFLLHDMGSRADGITQGKANGREMRTTPLWGIRVRSTFWHDGSENTLEGAILAHDGQGAGARERFLALSAEEKQRLFAFLESL